MDYANQDQIKKKLITHFERCGLYFVKTNILEKKCYVTVTSQYVTNVYLYIPRVAPETH